MEMVNRPSHSQFILNDAMYPIWILNKLNKNKIKWDGILWMH